MSNLARRFPPATLAAAGRLRQPHPLDEAAHRDPGTLTIVQRDVDSGYVRKTC
ncbi:hypothetical protein OG555_21485 [Kribbella sp. NBC_01484]|uniref:hypothetical protein n=1 Tax=Kribbella sp. NBC_01484 TaxID=2903579 RepID=UPI002E2F7956|nr:hypothetical protein [Kribbella sp. NBC_01484]